MTKKVQLIREPLQQYLHFKGSEIAAGNLHQFLLRECDSALRLAIWRQQGFQQPCGSVPGVGFAVAAGRKFCKGLRQHVA